MEKTIGTSEAERWVKDIFDYISQDDQGAAEKVVNGIHGGAQMLLQHRCCGICL